ncbi:Hypothetical predicted protein [Mytilus galloprovincialis]|uniref:Integrase zinc-binding domain-containing protein n=1 Tax=Mytilus galloprovincialis TaxID=29158 RepID=A0A8B6EP04_MYTGA|nr:Hypothetical predicted protein [Mytilus galloprovincialis]
MAEEISQYLKRKNTADSLQELENHESVYTNVELSADEVFRDIQRIQQRTKTKSVKSVRSNGRSSVASSTTKMKARAEAAKASLEFAAKEAELKKADAEIQRKQMDIQADLEFLSKQKEAAVAYAEYKAAMEDDDSQHDAKSLQGIPKQDELDRTRQYVESHRNVTFNSQNFRDNPVHSNTHLGDHTSAPFIPSTHQDQMPASKYNDPGFKFESDQNNNSPQARDKESGRSSQRPRLSARNINVSKTEIATSTEGIKPIKLKCAIHKTNHSLNDCRSFLSKSIEDRRKIIKENGICFKCINSKDHLSRNCPENVQCKECDSSTHSSGMHIYGQQKMQPLEPNGGEQSEDASKVVKACCMDICNGKFSGKSCAKILPVFVSHEDDPSKRIKTYIILDEQSNRSLGRKELFDSFDIVCKPEEYTLMSCSGRTRMNGRRVSGLLLESLDGERLPNNFPMALRRAKTLDRSLQSNKEKREHFLEFMHNLIQNNHAEIAPKLDEGAESWYLPVFGIYHPKKPGKIRCVFDSSAKFGDVSLNNVLLQGPDLNNSLLSVLMRFRKNRIAASADVQQMFYSFSVDEKHRDFLRFLWHEDNDLDKQLVAFRMTVHVFGNSPSPAVATYGLRKCSNLAEPDRVQRHFYVDDGLISLDSSQDMIDLLTRTQKTLLEEGNIRLHKFASNSDEVMSALPHEDLAQDLKSIDFDSDSVPLQRSLGLYWDLATDCFTYRISEESKPFTRRGVLSTLNSLFDPLGFVAPVIIKGKIILRELMAQSVDWDEPLPEHSRSEWETWRNSLSALQNITIPRMYVSSSLSKKPTFELHVFADASEKAIAAVSYLRTIKPDGNFETGFILGKAKVAPHHGHTIPSQSADQATRSVSSEDIGSSCWLQGPTKFLSGELQASASTETLTTLVNPDLDKEVRPIVTVTKTTIEDSHSIGSERFQNFSSWKSLVNGIAVLQRFIQSRFKKVTLQDIDVVKSLNESEIFIIKTIQSEVYSSEIDCIVNGQNLRKNSSIISLDPFLDSEGILRVGGRLNKSNLPYQERNPLILPGKCHVSKLLVQHFHAQVKHQGRHFTEGAIRAEGYWITGSKRLVSSVIHHCVPCRKLRGCLEVQKDG